jgi:hypothetical protein
MGRGVAGNKSCQSPMACGLDVAGRSEQKATESRINKQRKIGEAGRDSLLFLLSVITGSSNGLMGRGGGVWWLLACWQLR